MFDKMKLIFAFRKYSVILSLYKKILKNGNLVSTLRF